MSKSFAPAPRQVKPEATTPAGHGITRSRWLDSERQEAQESSWLRPSARWQPRPFDEPPKQHVQGWPLEGGRSFGTMHAVPGHIQREPEAKKKPPADGGALDNARRYIHKLDYLAIRYIKTIEDFGPATDAERLAFIRVLLKQSWVGPLDEGALERIWGSFGARVLTVAGAHPDLWAQSRERGAALDDLRAIEDIKKKFRADVRALAQDTLARNEAHVIAEMEALGIAEGGTPDSVTVPVEDEALADIQELAQQAAAARHALKALRHVPVGFNRYYSKSGFLSYTPASFDPEKQPALHLLEEVPAQQRSRVGVGSQDELRDWNDVKNHHDRLQAVLASLAARSPGLYAVLAGNDERELADVAAAEPRQARRLIAESLHTVLRNIRATVPKIGDDLDDRDLTPLHQQLFAGTRGKSGIDWSEPLHQWAAQDLLSDHETREFWISLGLGTLAAAAFLVAEFATAGSATFFLAASAGAGIGGAMSARGWEHWEDLETAAGASASAEGQIVSRGQADTALVTAVVDSAFAFLDLIPGARALRTAGKGAKTFKGIKGIKAGVGAGAEKVAQEAAEAGAKKAIAEGATQQAKKAARRLRPEEAKNWSALQPYLGKNIGKIGEPPPGYRKFELGGRKFLRRIEANDQKFARLTVDPAGIIKAGPARPQRLSKPHRVAKNVKKHLLGGKPRPAHHQAHHLVPDQVVRDHPLMRAAHERGLFDLDDPSNLVLLAKNAEAREAGKIATDLPLQSGSHKNYNELVSKYATDVHSELKRAGYKYLERMPPELLREAAQDVQEFARQLVETWMNTQRKGRLF